MSQLPLDQAIPRFQANEDRLNVFANGDTNATYISSEGIPVPSIQKFLAAKDTQINVGASSVLALATAQAEDAEDSAIAAAASAIAAAGSASGAASAATTAVNAHKTELATNGAALNGYSPLGGTTTTVEKQLRRTASDLNNAGAVDAANFSASPAYAAVSVNLLRTVIDRHAFEDWTTIATTSETGQGYSSFDAKVTMTNTAPQSHLVGYQSRNTYAGSGGLVDYFHGYDVSLTHSGTGTVNKAKGLHISELLGSGPVTNNYGIYMDGNLRGTNAWSIYVAAGKSYLGDELYTSIIVSGIKDGGITYGVDVSGKSLSYGYGYPSATHFGRHDFYDGKGGLVFSVTPNGTTTEGVLEYKSYTRANLPAARVGAIAWCSDGRKVGEGPGAGTGVPVYCTPGNWRTFSTDAPVQV